MVNFEHLTQKKEKKSRS